LYSPLHRIYQVVSLLQVFPPKSSMHF
jgi:hypothetical protein